MSNQPLSPFAQSLAKTLAERQAARQQQPSRAQQIKAALDERKQNTPYPNLSPKARAIALALDQRRKESPNPLHRAANKLEEIHEGVGQMAQVTVSVMAETLQTQQGMASSLESLVEVHEMMMASSNPAVALAMVWEDKVKPFIEAQGGVEKLLEKVAAAFQASVKEAVESPQIRALLYVIKEIVQGVQQPAPTASQEKSEVAQADSAATPQKMTWKRIQKEADALPDSLQKSLLLALMKKAKEKGEHPTAFWASNRHIVDNVKEGDFIPAETVVVRHTQTPKEEVPYAVVAEEVQQPAPEIPLKQAPTSSTTSSSTDSASPLTHHPKVNGSVSLTKLP